MRILEIETFGRGGLTHYVYNLSCGLAERGHEVLFLTTVSYELEDRELPDNVRLIRAIGRLEGAIIGSSPGFAARLVRRVGALADACAVGLKARRLRPDVVHLHCTNQVALAYLWWLRWSRSRVVTTAHVVTPHEPIRFQEAIYRRIHREPELVIAHSDFDRGRLVGEFGVDPGRVVVIPHGEYGFFGSQGRPLGREAARARLGLDAHAEVALFFGYIREYKGLDVLLEAWPTVRRARPRARLLVAGDPRQLDRARRRELEAAATRVGAIHRFGYVPFDDVARYFGAADVLVMPYRHISQSGVLYLALSLGVPVVATRVGALPEVLRDEVSALLVPPEAPAALSDALIRVLADRDLRDRLAEGGRRVADEHSWPAIAEKTESAFSRLG